MTPRSADAPVRSGGARRAEPGEASRARRPALDAWALACSVMVAVLAAVLSSVVFGRIPHVQDSIAQLFQARIFASGRLWAPSPSLREFFDYAHMINDGRWYCQYPPGHALFLVPGVWLGVPWLINPILGGLSIYGTYALAREAFGVMAGRVATLLGLFSPFLVLMASEFMAHVSGLCVMTWFIVFCLRWERAGRIRDGVAAGSCLLFAVLIRPYTAFAVALPVLAHAGASLRGRMGFAWRPLAWTLAGGAAGVLLLGLYNWGTTGDPLVPGYIRLYGPSHGLGFGKGSWGPPHTLARGLRHAAQSLGSLNQRLFEWPLTSLWPLAVAWIPIGRRGGTVAPTRTDEQLRPGIPHARVLLTAIPAAVLVAYVLYWYHDLCFGPRYLYEALGPILALSAFGLVRTGEFLSRRFRTSRDRYVHPRWILLVILGVLFGLASIVGWPALFRTPGLAVGASPDSGVRMGSYFQHYGREFWGVSPRLGRTVDALVKERALVFVRFTEPEPDLLQFRYQWFGSAFAHMEPDQSRARVIYARDRGEEDARLAALYPDRAVYLYRGSIEDGTLSRLRPPLAPGQ